MCEMHTLNAFELLGLPPAFVLDQNALDQHYFKAQRAWHPDRFVGRSPHEQAHAIHMSMTLNGAYTQLKAPLGRAKILLELAGMDPYAPSPPDLLMEMMELRESPPSPKALHALIQDTSKDFESFFVTRDFGGALGAYQRLCFLEKIQEDGAP